MSKRNKKGGHMKGEKQTLSRKDVAAVKAVDAEQKTAEAKPMVLKLLKKDAKFRGARDAWYKRLVEFDGKTLDEYVKDCTDNCPQLTKNSTKEPPMGWVGFFKRQGVLEVRPGE